MAAPTLALYEESGEDILKEKTHRSPALGDVHPSGETLTEVRVTVTPFRGRAWGCVAKREC